MKLVAWIAHHLESREFVDDYIAEVGKYLDEHEFVVCEDEECVKREIVDADAMIAWRITPEVFANARKLSWIQFGSAGIDHTLFPGLLESDVVLTTLSGIHSSAVAEHVFAMILTLTRRMDVSSKLQSEKRYDRTEIAATADELAGKTIGIVGLGRIGQSIGRIAMAFGMAVLGTKRTPSDDVVADHVYAPTDLHTMLPECDILVLVAPLTSETQDLIGREEIGLMKDGSYLVNVARGAMLDHQALAEALRSGKLAGAALDVFPSEPVPPDSELYDLPNLVITPHVAGAHPEYGQRAADIFKCNLDAFLTGGEMVNVYEGLR